MSYVLLAVWTWLCWPTWGDSVCKQCKTGDSRECFLGCACVRVCRKPETACMDKGDQGPFQDQALTRQLRHECRVPPGQLYDRDEQCRLQFRHLKNRYHQGHRFIYCSRTTYGKRDICKHLYCDDGDRRKGCFTTYTPAMDGTVCGHNKVGCLSTAHLLHTRPTPRASRRSSKRKTL